MFRMSIVYFGIPRLFEARPPENKMRPNKSPHHSLRRPSSSPIMIVGSDLLPLQTTKDRRFISKWYQNTENSFHWDSGTSKCHILELPFCRLMRLEYLCCHQMELACCHLSPNGNHLILNHGSTDHVYLVIADVAQHRWMNWLLENPFDYSLLLNDWNLAKQN